MTALRVLGQHSGSTNEMIRAYTETKSKENQSKAYVAPQVFLCEKKELQQITDQIHLHKKTNIHNTHIGKKSAFLDTKQIIIIYCKG